MNESLHIDNATILGHVCSLIAEGKRVKIHAKGDSMRPFIREESDSLIIGPADTLHIGDIVLARTDDGDYVVHRIIHIADDNVTLAGDGNLFRRETARREHIYGKIETIIRNGTHRSLYDFTARLAAFVWRMLLPLRRMKWSCERILRTLITLKRTEYEKS